MDKIIKSELYIAEGFDKDVSRTEYIRWNLNWTNHTSQEVEWPMNLERQKGIYLIDPLPGVWLTGDLTNHNTESIIFVWHTYQIGK